MGLADAGRAADEERVVRLRGHLGHGEGGRVGEPVGVADDELVEGQLGVGQWPAVRGELGRAGRWGAPAGAAVDGTGRSRGTARGGARIGWWGGQAGRVLRQDELHDRLAPEDQLGAGLEDRAEAVLDPAAGVRWRPDQEALTVELERAQRLQPEVVGGVLDGQGELGLHPRPDVLELAAHGSVDWLLSGSR